MTDSCKGKDFDQLKRGAWTLEEDNILIHYINCHGDGRWNSLAKSAGLKRTGKSCRLRWLNYLKPDTKRGNLTPQEQLVILELHAKWGNRWSRIAHHLPGRTDNEIKNYWRTRVLKQARHLKIDSSSKRFVEALHRFWMPRLLEKVEQTSSASILSNSTASTDLTIETDKKKSTEQAQLSPSQPNNTICASDSCWKMMLPQLNDQLSQLYAYNNLPFQNIDCNYNYNYIEATNELDFGSDSLNFHLADSNGIRTDGMAADTYWNMDELW